VRAAETITALVTADSFASVPDEPAWGQDAVSGRYVKSKPWDFRMMAPARMGGSRPQRLAKDGGFFQGGAMVGAPK